LGLKKELWEIEEKNVRIIKTNILRMMNNINQKGDKGVYTGNRTTLNNITVLTAALKEVFKQIG
jgi:hypothetical protein